MIFSSIDPATLTDPQPWVEHELERRLSQEEVDAANALDRCWYGLAFEPRTKATNHPHNPILSDLREARKRGDDFTDAESVLARLDDMTAGSDAWSHDAAHIEHAELVLNRLHRIYESENNS